MTPTETTPLEPTGTRHIRVWWTDNITEKTEVIAWYDYHGEFDIKAFLEYARNVICTGLKEEDFDLKYLQKEEDLKEYEVQDIYLRRFENARV